MLFRSEKWAAAANLRSYLVNLRLSCAYDLDDLPAVVEGMGTLVGVDGFFEQKIRGTPLKLRADQLRKFPQFLTLRKDLPGGAAQGGTAAAVALVSQALDDLQKAVTATNNSYNAVVARGKGLGGQVDEYFAIRSDRVLPSQRPMELALKDMSSLVAGKTQVYSAILNKPVTVDLPGLFRPEPPADLKAFLPQQFVETDTKQVDGLSVRNYLWGSPTAWDVAAYKKLFPDLQNAGDVAAASRTLAQSWGGALVNGPLLSFVN